MSTGRYHNNEITTLNTPYDTTCVYQGIAAGWGDDYFIGLDCQWIDITDLDLSGGPVQHPLTFTSNPEQFLCEGKPVLDDQGMPTWEPTEFVTEMGAPIDRPVCDFMDGWDNNNSETVMVDVPVVGAYQNEPCNGQQIGPRRSCGFTIDQQALSCAPGAQVDLSCSVSDGSQPMVVRVCEDSHALDEIIPCTFRGSRVTQVIDGASQTVSFTCPDARDAVEVGGRYSLMVGPLVSDGPSQTVTCQ